MGTHNFYSEPFRVKDVENFLGFLENFGHLDVDNFEVIDKSKNLIQFSPIRDDLFIGLLPSRIYIGKLIDWRLLDEYELHNGPYVDPFCCFDDCPEDFKKKVWANYAEEFETHLVDKDPVVFLDVDFMDEILLKKWTLNPGKGATLSSEFIEY